MIAVAVIGPIPGMVISRRAIGSSRERRAISRIQTGDLRVHHLQAVDQHLEHRPCALRQLRGRVLDPRDQPRHVRRSLWHDTSIFRQVTAQSVDQLGPLLHQKIARPEHNGRWPAAPHPSRPRTAYWAAGRLADRLRISRIILMPLDERFDIRRRDQADRVTQLRRSRGPSDAPRRTPPGPPGTAAARP